MDQSRQYLHVAGGCIFILVFWGNALASESTNTASPQLAEQKQSAPINQATTASKKITIEEAAWQLKLRELEERVNQMKEKIFQSKARLMQLQEVLLQEDVGASKAIVLHQNDMGSSFRLTQIQYALDGAPIFNRIDEGDGALDALDEFEIFAGSVTPGNHQLSVYLEYQGYGYGIFSYLQDYHFKVKSSYTFTAQENKVVIIKSVGFEKGGFTAELKDRPAIRFDIEMQMLNEKNAAHNASQKDPPRPVNNHAATP